MSQAKGLRVGLMGSFICTLLVGCTTDDVSEPAPTPDDIELYLIPDAAFGEYLLYREIPGIQAIEEEGETQYYIDVNLVDGVSELSLSKTSSSVETLSEAGVVTAETKITDLDGIQHFVNLQVLKLTSNALTQLDTSALTKLTTLELNFNLIGSFDLTQNTALERFRFKASSNADDSQKISSIDLSGNPNLRHLYLPRHNLVSIDLSNNPLIDDTLDLSENPGPDGDPATEDIVVPDAIFQQVPDDSRAGVVSDAAVEVMVSIGIDQAVVEEAGGTAVITATLNTTSVVPVTLTLGLAGTAESGTDFTLASDTLVIAPGDTNAATSVTVLDDDEIEGGETLTVTIASVEGASLGGTTEVSLSIADDDFPINLIVNEILYDPWNSDLEGDANGDGQYAQAEDEFIEFVNMGEAAVDMSGYTIQDTEGIEAATFNHVFPEGTVLQPGKALVVFGGGTPTGEFGGAIVQVSTSGDMNLNNAGDVMTLSDADGLVILSFDIEPLSNNPNESYTRNPDLTGDFVQHGSINEILFSPGTKVDGSSF